MGTGTQTFVGRTVVGVPVPIIRSALLCGALVVAAHLGTLAASLNLGLDLAPAVRQAIAEVSGDVVRFQLLLALGVFAVGFSAGLFAHAVLRLLQVKTALAPVVGLLGVAAIVARTLALKPGLFDALHVRGLQKLFAERIGLAALDHALLALGAVALVVILVRTPRSRFVFATAGVAALAFRFVQPKPPKPVHGIVVLAADSLRPDRVTDATAPNLRKLLERSAVASDVFVPIASTTASWASMLTGLYPHGHGIRDLFPRDDVIRVPAETLPRVLAAHGWETAVVSDYAGESFSRVALGFGEVDAPPATSLEVFAEREAIQRLPIALGLFSGAFGQRLFPVTRYLLTNADPSELTARAFAKLEDLEKRGKPFLLIVFYSVTHAPFAAPMPDARMFADPAYDGASRYAYDVQQLSDIARVSERPSDAEVAQVRALYDGAMHSFDREVGRFVGRVPPDVVLAVTGDHGENLFEPGATTEHGKWFEGGEAANRTLLALSGPSVKPRPLAALASGVDFMPTMLDLAGIPLPGGLDGVSLLRDPPRDRTVFAETATWLGGKSDTPPGAMAYPPLLDLLEVEQGTHALVLKRQYVDRTVTAKLRAARRGPWELVYLPTATGPRLRLVNLETDPYAQKDVLAEHPDVAASLQHDLYAWMEQDRLRWFDAEMKLVPRVEQ